MKLDNIAYFIKENNFANTFSPSEILHKSGYNYLNWPTFSSIRKK
jgi:hypothetical protein